MSFLFLVVFFKILCRNLLCFKVCCWSVHGGCVTDGLSLICLAVCSLFSVLRCSCLCVCTGMYAMQPSPKGCATTTTTTTTTTRPREQDLTNHLFSFFVEALLSIYFPLAIAKFCSQDFPGSS